MRQSHRHRGSSPFAHASALLGAMLVSAPALGAQIVVNCGDDLEAIVASAPDGSVIELHGDCVFEASLNWTAKSLTIQPGPGFAPVLRGEPGSGVLTLTNSDPPARATLIDLLVVRGATIFDPVFGEMEPFAMSFSGTGSNPEYVELTLQDCVVVGIFGSSGTGMHRFTGDFSGTSFSDRVSFGGTGDLIQTVSIEDSTVRGALTVSITGSADVDLDVARTRAFQGISVSAISTSSTDVFVESSLVQNRLGLGLTGMRVSTLSSGVAVARAVNTTITGFTTGITGLPTATWENMLLFDNSSDVGTGVTSALIANSLISDGTFAGVNGNFGGNPSVDPSGALLAGSLGIDAGNDAAAGLGALDLNGRPRIQDGDGDLTATVDVGAVETIGVTWAATEGFFGSGANPVEHVPVTQPVVGGTYVASIDTSSMTVSTQVVLAAGQTAPFSLAPILGELLLAAPLFAVDGGIFPGVHLLSVPSLPSLVGASASSQGFRIDATGAGLAIQALNGVELLLGN